MCIRGHQTLLKSFSNLQRLNLFIHLKPREYPNRKENQLSSQLNDVLSHITELSSWSATKKWQIFNSIAVKCDAVGITLQEEQGNKGIHPTGALWKKMK